MESKSTIFLKTNSQEIYNLYCYTLSNSDQTSQNLPIPGYSNMIYDFNITHNNKI